MMLFFQLDLIAISRRTIGSVVLALGHINVEMYRLFSFLFVLISLVA